jgi:hypothetical protein
MASVDVVAQRLPSPHELERRCIALATLDAILSAEWEYRYYSFSRNWDPEAKRRMASMRNGSGDEFFILFFADGAAAIKGFDHESPALGRRPTVEGALDGLPQSLAAFANEPAFSIQNTTFCLWNVGGGWKRSRSLAPRVIEYDGSSQLLRHLVGGAAEYAKHAHDYFEVEVSTSIVDRFLRLEPLTTRLAWELSGDADLDEIASDLEEIGYPRAPSQNE